MGLEEREEYLTQGRRLYVGRFSKIDDLLSRCESPPTGTNPLNPPCQGGLLNLQGEQPCGRGDLAPTIDDAPQIMPHLAPKGRYVYKP